MVDPVNLNVPGLPYLLVAAAFFAVVALLSGLLSPIELVVRRHRRSENEDDKDNEEDRKGEWSPRPDPEAVTTAGIDPFATDRPAGPEPAAGPTIVYECRHCGTTLDAGDRQCPRCETASIARYDVG